MGLDNLLEYGKTGLGVALASSGINADIGAYQSHVIGQEALYRTLETTTPETILQVKQIFDTYMYNNTPMKDAVFSIGLEIAGVMLVASGIYNLVKNYKKGKKE